MMLLPLPLFPASMQCLAVLLKALQGEVPWATYCQLLGSSSKDHATAISITEFVRCLVTGVSQHLFVFAITVIAVAMTATTNQLQQLLIITMRPVKRALKQQPFYHI
jgi:hypothetical protein